MKIGFEFCSAIFVIPSVSTSVYVFFDARSERKGRREIIELRGLKLSDSFPFLCLPFFLSLKLRQAFCLRTTKFVSLIPGMKITQLKAHRVYVLCLDFWTISTWKLKEVETIDYWSGKLEYRCLDSRISCTTSSVSMSLDSYWMFIFQLYCRVFIILVSLCELKFSGATIAKEKKRQTDKQPS